MASQSRPQSHAESSTKKLSPTGERVKADDETLESPTQESLTFMLLQKLDRDDADDPDYIPGPTPPTSESDSEDSAEDDEDDWETSEESSEEQEDPEVLEAAPTSPVDYCERSDYTRSDHVLPEEEEFEEVDATSKISSDSENDASESESDEENLTRLLLPDKLRIAVYGKEDEGDDK